MVLDDLLTGMATALGTSVDVVEMILAIAILVSIGLALAAMKMNLTGEVIVLLGVAGVLVVIGWLEWWLLALAGLLISAMFAKQIADWISGGGGEK